MEETGRYAMAICKFLAHEKHGVQLANSNIIQQYQKAVIYSNFKPAWLLDIIELSKLQIFKIGVVQTAFTIPIRNRKTV